jgi:predicted glycoside hydrolase/deacetylase ChbG (UPF0249 family)
VKRLIVNADDFGLTRGVNRAVLELFRNGTLTSATLMANSAEAESAAASTQNTGIGVGCHVVLVDGVPVSTPSEIPSLIDPRNPGAFRPTLGKFVSDLLRGRICEVDIETEAAAQIRRLRQMGLSPTHLDTHKHTHVFPRVLRPLLRAALICGVRSIRNPFEPEWSVAAAPGGGLVRRLQLRALRSQRTYFLKATRTSGIATTDGAIGIGITGHLDVTSLSKLFRAMPDGTWELVCHPGYVDAELKTVHTRLVESSEIERRSLLEVIPATAADPEFSLIHFGQLVAEP